MNALRAIAGVALFVGFVVTLVNAFTPFFSYWLGGAWLWLAGLILFFDLDAKQKNTYFDHCVARLRWLASCLANGAI